MMPEADMELPYEGSKEMILVDDVENKEFLQNLLDLRNWVLREITKE